MKVLGNISANSGKPVNMDLWFWCPWCQVREWFSYVQDKKYRCGHCSNELEIRNTN